MNYDKILSHKAKKKPSQNRTNRRKEKEQGRLLFFYVQVAMNWNELLT